MAWTRVVLTKVLDSFSRAFQVNGWRIAKRCASWTELANTFQFIIYQSFYPDLYNLIYWPTVLMATYSTRGRHMPVTSLSIAGLIPQSCQLQAQVKLVSLGWRQNKWACANSYALRSACFCSQIGGGAIIRLSAYIATAVMWQKYEGRNVCKTRAEGCNAKLRGLCGCNSVIPVVVQACYNCKFERC
jgi:hypothetical protein